jgi:hypothetical protein
MSDWELQDRIVRVTPNSIRAKEIIGERKVKQEKDRKFKRLSDQVKTMSGERFIVNPATKNIEERTTPLA